MVTHVFVKSLELEDGSVSVLSLSVMDVKKADTVKPTLDGASVS